MFAEMLTKRSSPPATKSERYAVPPTSEERTSPMCAVSALIASSGVLAYWTAFPASIVGISVSPAARPNPRSAEDHIHCLDAGRTTIAMFCSLVKPSAADVSLVSDSIVLKALSIESTIVGIIRRLSTMEAVSQENPEPPRPFLIRGTRRKTDAKP